MQRIDSNYMIEFGIHNSMNKEICNIEHNNVASNATNNEFQITRKKYIYIYELNKINQKQNENKK